MEIRTLSSRTVYENRWMRVREDRIQREDGSSGVYGVVDKPDFIVVIPRDEEGSFFLVEQFRYPVGERFWEFPQGSWEERRSLPETLARAELSEETGLRAGTMKHLGRLYEAYGFCSQAFNVFLATECRHGRPERSPEEQGMRMGRFTAKELEEMMRTGAIKDGPSVAAYGLLSLSKA